MKGEQHRRSDQPTYCFATSVRWHRLPESPVKQGTQKTEARGSYAGLSLFGPSHEMDPDKNIMVRFARKFLPMTKKIRGDWFFTRRLKLWGASPLFMGLRELYFLLAGVMGMFIYLKYGISFILGFVGIKMILIMLGIHIPIAVSLGTIVLSLLVAVVASLLVAKRSDTVVSQEAA